MTPAQMRSLMRNRAYTFLAIPYLIFVIYLCQHGTEWWTLGPVTAGLITVAHVVAYILYPGD